MHGGHLVIAEALVRALQGAGHTASLVTTPECNFGHQVSAYIATWKTDIAAAARGPVDQVISLRFPSYAVRHERHVCWLNHAMREYYDQWPQFAASISSRGRVKERIKRRVAHIVDWWLLHRNVTKVVAQSATIQRRLAHDLGVRSDVLWPPAPPRAYRCDTYGDYIFAVSRLVPLKRIDLLIRAMAEPVARHVRAVIAGDGEFRQTLGDMAANLGVAKRVDFIGQIDDEALVKHLAACRAVYFAPYAEDYGFVTVEAFASAKPVVTCVDSGGPTELVKNEENGLVVQPTAPSIAEALARLTDDGALAAALGARGRAQADAMTWAAAVKQLLIV